MRAGVTGLVHIAIASFEFYEKVVALRGLRRAAKLLLWQLQEEMGPLLGSGHYSHIFDEGYIGCSRLCVILSILECD